MPKLASRVAVGLCALAAVGAARPALADGFSAPKLSLDPSVLTLADTAATQPQSWVDQVKNPAPGFTWGADQRIRLEYGNNFITLNQGAAGHEQDYFRYRTRIFASYTPIPELTFNARFMWEGRHYQNPEPPAWVGGWGEFDIMNLKLTLAAINTTITAGRQEMFIGDGWLIADGTNGDGGTTAYFDAVRSTTQFKDIQTTLDLIYINNYSTPDQWLPSVGEKESTYKNENNERGAIVWLSNKSIENLELNPYFMYKHDRAVLPASRGGTNADIYTFGTRAVAKLTPNITERIEFAGQFGDKDGRDLCAYGLNNRLSYNFNDPMRNELRLNFEYLSGDRQGTTGTDEAFDPLWGRWPQFSELYGYSYMRETRIFNITNLMRIGAGYLVRPAEGVELELDYDAMFANQNTYSGTAGYSSDGNFRGHHFQAIMRYKFNRHVSGHLMAEYLIPGNYYDATKQSEAAFLRAEILFTF